MKLKKIESTEMDESGATAIGDPFKLDAAPVQTIGSKFCLYRPHRKKDPTIILP